MNSTIRHASSAVKIRCFFRFNKRKRFLERHGVADFTLRRPYTLKRLFLSSSPHLHVHPWLRENSKLGRPPKDPNNITPILFELLLSGEHRITKLITHFTSVSRTSEYHSLQTDRFL